MIRDYTDKPRDVLKERRMRTEQNRDEVDSAFEDDACTIVRQYSIRKQNLDKLSNSYKSEIKRRDLNEFRRQNSFNDLQKNSTFRIRSNVNTKSMSIASSALNQNANIEKIEQNYNENPPVLKEEVINEMEGVKINKKIQNFEHKRTASSNVFNNNQNIFAVQTEPNYYDDYPKPRTIAENQYHWPATQQQMIKSHLKLSDSNLIKSKLKSKQFEQSEISSKNQDCRR